MIELRHAQWKKNRNSTINALNLRKNPKPKNRVFRILTLEASFFFKQPLKLT